MKSGTSCRMLVLQSDEAGSTATPSAAFEAGARANVRKIPKRQAKDVECWGHRGASAHLPENT